MDLESCRYLCKTKQNNKGIDRFALSDLHDMIEKGLKTEAERSFGEYTAEEIWKDSRNVIRKISADLEGYLYNAEDHLIFELTGIDVISNELQDRIEEEIQNRTIAESVRIRSEQENELRRIRDEQELAEKNHQLKLKRIQAESDRIDTETRLLNEKRAREIKEEEELESEKRQLRLKRIQEEIAKTELEKAAAEKERAHIIDARKEREKRWYDLIQRYTVRAAIYRGEIHDSFTDFKEFIINFSGDIGTVNGYTGDSKYVTIPSLFKYDNKSIRITSVGPKVFEGKYISSIRLEEGISKIGPSAFSSCRDLTDVELPDSLEEISEGAFRNCTKLTSISIPDNIRTIASDAFCGCIFLKKISVPADYDISCVEIPRRCSVERR